MITIFEEKKNVKDAVNFSYKIKFSSRFRILCSLFLRSQSIFFLNRRAVLRCFPSLEISFQCYLINRCLKTKLIEKMFNKKPELRF